MQFAPSDQSPPPTEAVDTDQTTVQCGEVQSRSYSRGTDIALVALMWSTAFFGVASNMRNNLPPDPIRLNALSVETTCSPTLEPDALYATNFKSLIAAHLLQRTMDPIDQGGTTARFGVAICRDINQVGVDYAALVMTDGRRILVEPSDATTVKDARVIVSRAVTAVNNDEVPTTGNYRIDELDSITAQVRAAADPGARVDFLRLGFVASVFGFALISFRKLGVL